ncbi:di-heme oxidoredictase family protein [Cytophagaceae bacterium YF14B1]|uniref:Di-heme oxidoredictase family protein n=1 Tax=Xanthocytophaga flava TaxID=3048013 RepID=A0AAE3UCY1_9BACT|nr:di-heme oxidoredictase family protein [Xanthocytophaga flavus]MDJ1485973.1 di-heme oxidoredictase family protein [Xanthocytophaga flavus]
MKTFSTFFATGLFAFSLLGCDWLMPRQKPENHLLDGPIEQLSPAENQRFLAGDKAFNLEVFTSQNGLGPLFVATSCGSCHAGDGKGHPFTTLIRFGQSDQSGNRFLNQGGPQLQQRALPGLLPETLPSGAAYSRFMPPANTGLGLLEYVTDSLLLAMEDPADSNQDGISGRVSWNYLPAYVDPKEGAIGQAGKYICRFGKKAAVYDLLQQTAVAYNQDMGIASSFEPIDTYTGQEVEPEVSNTKIQDLVFYLRTLKVPLRRNAQQPVVVAGEKLFFQIGCENCHRQTLRTGKSPISALSEKEFHPYTDLLLHQMGQDLDDGYTEGSADSDEWRTPPLWGLGLSPSSQGGGYFLLHDGRATSIEKAIEWHGGEALQSRQDFNALTLQEKQHLFAFLESL